MEQALRGIVTQLAVMAWQGKLKEARKMLQQFCDGDQEVFVFSNANHCTQVRDCICSHRELCIAELRKVSEKRSNYVASDAIQKILEKVNPKSPLRAVA